MCSSVQCHSYFCSRSRSHTNLGPKEDIKASGGERLQATSSRRGSDVQQEGEMLKAKPNQISSRSSSRRGSYNQAQGGSYTPQQGGEGLQAKPNQCSSRRASDVRRGSDGRFAEEDKRSIKGSAKDLAATDHHIV